MTTYSTRRRFLKSSAGVIALGSSEFGGLLPFTPVTAQETTVTPNLVQLRPEIKQLVKLIEATEREKCPELLAQQLHAGVPYRHLLAAAFLVAIGRGGHHEVYLMHSAHQLSLDVAPDQRLLPLFWGVDVMKEHLVRFKSQPVGPVSGKLPAADVALADFDDAMKSWDQERAIRAVLSLSRSGGGRTAMERLWPYAARDWSFIGHLAISVSNCWQTLETIGWQHADPVLSFVIRDLHRWSDKKLDSQPYSTNASRAKRDTEKLPFAWASAEADPKATLELLDVIRTGKWLAACEWTHRHIVGGQVSAGTVWDAVHVAAAEFMVQFKLGGTRITNRALHANTSANALHFAFRTCHDRQSRFLILLQAVGWVTGFLQNEKNRGMLRPISITEMPKVVLPDTPEEAVEALFSALPSRAFGTEIKDRSGQDEAARLAFAFGNAFPNSDLFLKTARRTLCRKATINAHDIKFPVAMFEDLEHVSPRWRPHMLAGVAHFLHGPKSQDNPIVEQATATLKA